MAKRGTQLYEELMRFRPDGLSPNGWAVKAGVSRTIWQDLRRHGNPSRRTLEKLLAVAGSSLAEFEALRVGRHAPDFDEGHAGSVGDVGPGFRGAALPPIPLIWCQSDGEWSSSGSGIEMIGIDRTRVLEELPRPSSLATDPGAYALTVPDNAMWPRFRLGRRVAVSPAAPIEIGDDVLVLIASPTGSGNGTRALLKELAGRSPNSLQLRQFTPDVTFEFPLQQDHSVHKVVGELI